MAAPISASRALSSSSLSKFFLVRSLLARSSPWHSTYSTKTTKTQRSRSPKISPSFATVKSEMGMLGGIEEKSASPVDIFSSVLSGDKKHELASVPRKEPADQTQEAPHLSDMKFSPRMELSELRRPSEIPWQSKIANSVQLIGSVTTPVHLELLPNDKYWAITTLAQEEFPHLRIPVVFEGDLAQIAIRHLRKNDLIYVAGHLSGVPSATEQAEITLQVLAQDLNFVNASKLTKSVKRTEEPCKRHDGMFVSSEKSSKSNPYEGYWRDLVANPQKWLDNRMSKLNKSVSSKFPDFKHKDTGVGLWLDSAPEWILPEMKGGQSEANSYKCDTGKSIKIDDNSWKDLVNNPNEWWDNRVDKRNGLHQKSPDFKHKGSGLGLWLNDAPDWVLPKIEGPRCIEKTGDGNKRVDNDDNTWRDLVNNPKQWRDNREAKLNGSIKPRSPDFKHKESGLGVWLDSAPQWVSTEIQGLKFQ